MPRGDGTGPSGQGSMTGRGLGSCGSDSEKNTPNKPRLGRLNGSRIGRGLNRIGRGLGLGQK